MGHGAWGMGHGAWGMEMKKIPNAKFDDAQCPVPNSQFDTILSASPSAGQKFLR
jgi:hypothetical protein